MKRLLIFGIVVLLCVTMVSAEDTITNSGSSIYIEPTITIAEDTTPVAEPASNTDIPQPSILESISNFIFGTNTIEDPLQHTIEEPTRTDSALILEDSDGSMIVSIPSNNIISNVTSADYTNQTLPHITRENGVDLSGVDFNQDVIAVRIESEDMIYIIRRG